LLQSVEYVWLPQREARPALRRLERAKKQLGHGNPKAEANALGEMLERMTELSNQGQ